MSHATRRLTLFLSIMLLMGAALGRAAEAPVVYGAPIPLDLAKKAAVAALATARGNGWTMAAAVVDVGGALVYFERIDGTQVASVEIAIAKARCANGFKRPTKSFEDRVAAGANKLLAIPSIMPVEGGIPILVDGKIVGALGVSGGSSEEDGVAAKAGIDALKQ
jgi:glc operon protein GlcG